MTTTKKTTEVYFKKIEDEIVAFFPAVLNPINHFIMSYEHTGQHSEAHINYMNEEGREATLEEYAPLLKELIVLCDYKDLKVLNKDLPKDYKHYTPSEPSKISGLIGDMLTSLMFDAEDTEIQKYVMDKLEDIKKEFQSLKPLYKFIVPTESYLKTKEQAKKQRREDKKEKGEI